MEKKVCAGEDTSISDLTASPKVEKQKDLIKPDAHVKKEKGSTGGKIPGT